MDMEPQAQIVSCVGDNPILLLLLKISNKFFNKDSGIKVFFNGSVEEFGIV